MNKTHPTAPKEFLVILRNALQKHKNKNRRASMRTFAKEIKISVSTLSEVFNEHKNFSLATATRIANTLNLNRLEKDIFVTSVKASKPGSERKSAEIRLQKLLSKRQAHQIQSHEISQINHWHYLAILDLIALGVQTASALASRLGLETIQVQRYLKTLEHLNWVKQNNSTYLLQIQSSNTIDDTPSLAIKQYHQSILTQAQKTLEETEVDSREFQSVILTVNSKKIAAAKEKIRKFVDEFCDEFSSIQLDPKIDDVFQLGLQYFKLTRP